MILADAPLIAFRGGLIKGFQARSSKLIITNDLPYHRATEDESGIAIQ
jgi:hypothetical protein